MEGAISNGIDGIVAECGGACQCATCHVYVDEAFLRLLNPIEEDEDQMLNTTASERRPNSRLTVKRVVEADHRRIEVKSEAFQGTEFIILLPAIHDGDTYAGPNTVQVEIGGQNATVVYAGAQGVYPGVDQVNVVIPQSLAGAGTVDIVMSTGGLMSNTENVLLQ